jgi:hypothetical protein
MIDLAVEQSQVSRIFGQLGDDALFCEVACGDFNDDGCDDIILGEPRTPSTTSEGKAYVVLGRSQFPDTLDLATSPSLVFTILGHGWTGWLGMGLCACDVNGDGYDEVITAASSMEFAEVYLIHGGETFQSTYYTGQHEPGMTRIVDHENDRAMGRSMACRDVDGDGYDDLFVGSPGNSSITMDGRAMLLYGRPALPDTILLSDESWQKITILPEYQHGQLGQDVEIGDVDHDGQYDLIVTAYQGDPLGCGDCGEVYVLYNATELPDTAHVDSTDLPITRLIGDESTVWFGICVLVDDLTNNSYDEIVVADWPDNRRARVAVAYGHTMPPDTVFQDTDTTITRIIEESQRSNLGYSLASGDFNGDNVGDLIMGARWASPLGRSYAGAAYVFYGVASSTAVKTPERRPELVLKPNFPNPFSTNTSFHFYLPRISDVTVTIYDVLGRRIATILEPLLEQGENILTWDGRDASGRQLPSGVYFYRVEAAGLSETRKLVLTR